MTQQRMRDTAAELAAVNAQPSRRDLGSAGADGRRNGGRVPRCCARQPHRAGIARCADAAAAWTGCCQHRRRSISEEPDAPRAG